MKYLLLKHYRGGPAPATLTGRSPQLGRSHLDRPRRPESYTPLLCGW
jgi:hypothetical protein